MDWIFVLDGHLDSFQVSVHAHIDTWWILDFSRIKGNIRDNNLYR
jgi:hypothetical protein